MKNNLIFIIAVFLFSCSAAKRTSKQVNDIETLQNQFDQQKESILAKGIADYINANPCVFPEISLDSLCSLCYPSTTLENRDTPYLYDYGSSLDINPFPPVGKDTVLKVKRILVPTPDNRMVKLLNDSLATYRIKVAQLEGKDAGQKETVKVISDINKKPAPWRFNYWGWLAIVLFIVLAGAGIFFFKTKFK